MFEALGLSAAAEALYLELLDRPGTAPGALVTTGRDADHVTAAVTELREAGLLLPDARCTAVAPDLAVELLARRQEEHVRQARAAVEPMLTRYRQAAGSADPVEVVTGTEQVALRYEQLVRCARREILGFDKPPYVRPVRDLAMELATLGQRVRFRAVYARAALTGPGRLSDVDTLKNAGEQARIMPDLPFKLIIVDRRWAMVPISEGTEAERAMVLRPCSLFDALLATFDAYWERAVPFGDTRSRGAGGDLSDPDRQLLALLATGLTDERIAAHLGLGLRTVQRRVRGLMDRLGAGNRFQAGLQAARGGLL
ncbi:LuxR C-terminal-related transcriptional regulator [Actinocatenispora rupis]|uniref:Transcriptional regulator n=1 Tax=Actinocatenispora rupis TaxID=519421 RepID=A0A8J3NCK7_9ACTN|nr:LuxR C-terminal-related transcriptional regulator [Actinocatenispora rupis]GID14419.1 transcriptional regulator [Actinocatenispora rupis]